MFAEPIHIGPGGRFVAFSPDGKTIATTGSGPPGTIWILDAQAARTGETIDDVLLAEVNAYDNFISEVTFTPDGSLLAVGGIEDTITIWVTHDWTRALSIPVGREQESLAINDDNTVLATSETDSNVVQLFTLDLQQLVEIARSRVTRSFTDEECRRFLHLESGCSG